MIEHLKKDIFVLLALVFIGLGVFISLTALQSQFTHIVGGFTISFIAYFYITSKDALDNLKSILILAIIAKCALIFHFPNLSDDIDRFYWDGLLSQNGINPYSVLPEEVLALDITSQFSTLFSELNSPQYYTIYPPVSQLLFYVASFAEDINQFSLMLKSLFVLFDILNLYLIWVILKLLKLKSEYALIYFLNPLVIVEGLGNLHFELIMVSFLLTFLLMLIRKKSFLLTSLYYCLAIATKLTPLILGPLILYYNRNLTKNLKFLFTGLIIMSLLFIPLYTGFNWLNLADSIDLYFRKFEFNASIYYVLREVGEYLSGYNLIRYVGPGLAFISLALILGVYKNQTKNELSSFIKHAIIAYSVYLFLSTTVHPWYLIPLVTLTCFVRYNYVMIWSFLIGLSYWAYSQTNWEESMFILAIEYILVYYLFYVEVLIGRKVKGQ